MISAVERLASELVKLSAADWTKLSELRWAAETAELLDEFGRGSVTTVTAGEALVDDAPPKLIVRSWNQASCDIS